MKQKKDIKNIELSFVCPQNWDNMTICGNERYCGVCQKTVYDFTDKSQKEYDDIVQKQDGQICGRFRKAQMTPSVKQPIITVNFAKVAAFTAFSLMTTGCKVEKLDSFAPKIIANDRETKPETSDSETVFFGIVAETQPEFIGGQIAMFQFLSDNLKWPKDVCGEGTVYVGFVVNFDGSLSDIHVKRGIHIFNEEALRVVKLMSVGMWKGAKQSGKPTKVAYTIPIKFKLE
jgi:Gram-negative bacterial TonB protein C-terminal